ncbi:MAG: aminoacetone oxidase family FAD-binding enzyme [Clostridia bacterium]|nr:aminoacetone oxidase family FAD-binding enzyme [Clostridia bacterium]
MKKLNIAVIGGGASGIYFALNCKKSLPQSKITIFEKNERPLKKVKASGNGRCNLSNENTDIKFYNTDNFIIANALKKYGLAVLINFYNDLHLPLTVEDSRVYPATESSETVVRTLKNACEANNIKIITDTNIENLTGYNFDYIVLATGSNAGTMGSKDAYKLCEGLKINPAFPSLTGISVENENFENISGIRTTAKASLYIDRKEIYTEIGQIQFNKNGLSGIPILQISHFITEKNIKKAKIFLDFFPFTEENNLRKILYEIKKDFAKLSLFSLLDSLVHHRLGMFLSKQAKIKCKDRQISDLSDSEIENLIKILKSKEFTIGKLNDFKSAQCSKGGIDLSEINDDFSLKSNNKIFVIGELLDVNGMCGGYNLQFAFSSAKAAAEGIKNRYD